MSAKHLILSAFLLTSSLVACSSGTSGEDQDDVLPSGDAERGLALTNASSCAECHQADYGGAGFYPNITSDPRFGVGRWTDAELARALRYGLDDEGGTLCSLMERFPFSPQQTADVIAYLRTLPAIPRQTQSECPGHEDAEP